MHSIESRFVIGHQIYCLQACKCALFSPEILRRGIVKGLTDSDEEIDELLLRITLQRTRRDLHTCSLCHELHGGSCRVPRTLTSFLRPFVRSLFCRPLVCIIIDCQSFPFSNNRCRCLCTFRLHI